MAPVVLKNFELPISCEDFLHKFWFNVAYFERFLIEKLLDVGVEISEWKQVGDHPINRNRTVRSLHPSKISFPGLPSHAESTKNQTIECRSQPGQTVEQVIVKEVNSFNGIPYADYFHVMVEWDVKSIAPISTTNAGQKVKVVVSLDFKFFKSTWLQGTIESNTKAELMEVYELWISFANEFLRNEETANLHKHHHGHHHGQHHHHHQKPALSLDSKQLSSHMEPAVARSPIASPIENKSSLASVSKDSLVGSVSKYEHTENQHIHNIGYTSGDDDEELLFYDCEQGEHTPMPHDIRGTSSMSGSNALYQRIVPPPTPPDLRRMYPSRSLESLSTSSHGNREDKNRHKNSFDEDESGDEAIANSSLDNSGSSNNSSNHSYSEDDRYRNSEAARKKRYQKQLRQYRHGSTRDKAIQVVETIFVLLEFSFWQIYQFYCYELKDLFDITPDRVWSRCINTFLPGWHGSILSQPDLYGPLLGVFMLPLTLLWSTQTSRHGCNPTSQLGNAVVVSLLIWIGLSGLYRGLSMILAPHILYKHCLSIVGYSFVCWNIALMMSLMLEPFKDMLPLVNAYLPLVFLGLPASIAQGLMFWEHTPASSLTLQPSSLPQSMQQCATNNARLIQRFLWALPKIIAFVLIAGTHYQLLWYLARVFLPGRRQLCQLTALIRPTRYAEILAQKDLRVFALQLLNGES